ncbi:MAG: threonine synthase [Eubacteriales bacterium]|nr:threonine synthase [Eubacteriales bacterium]
MIYHSTRNKQETADSRQAVLKGLCGDGGLFVSDALGERKLDPEELLTLSYQELALRVFSLLLDDYTEEELSDAIEKAYGTTFSKNEVTPVTKIGDDWLLELYHGPTSAFKDVALCMLPQLMSKALSGSGKKIMIITATSGDTGKAALSGFQDVENIGITVFYPDGKVSDIQKLQMASQEGRNVAVCAIRGNFDDAQSAVKEIFASEIGAELEKRNIALSSANSINIGRLIPQIVYYFEAYKALRKNGTIQAGQEIDFCVPTGNFGDVLAGYYAKLLGLPVHRLIVASNANNVLTDFIMTGVYDRNRPFHKTISPSMDILISSNLERMLYYLSGKDADYIASLMRSLKETGRYEVSGELLSKIQEIFSAGCADDAETEAAIRKAYETDGRLIDPHTAVGYKVLSERRTEGVPAVLLSTASPYKFCRDVYESLFGAANTGADGFAYMRMLSEKTGVEPPEPLRELQGKPVLHRDVIDIADMKQYVLNAALEKL